MVSPESLNQCMKSWVSSLIPSLAEKLEAEEEEQNKKKKKKPDDCNRRKRNPLDREDEKV